MVTLSFSRRSCFIPPLKAQVHCDVGQKTASPRERLSRLFYSVRGVKAMPKKNLNEATLRDLLAVPSIGPILARRILKRRTKLGGFRSWWDVWNIHGLGLGFALGLGHKRSIALQEHFDLPPASG